MTQQQRHLSLVDVSLRVRRQRAVVANLSCETGRDGCIWRQDTGIAGKAQFYCSVQFPFPFVSRQGFVVRLAATPFPGCPQFCMPLAFRPGALGVLRLTEQEVIGVEGGE
jgi:hypothetical protein